MSEHYSNKQFQSLFAWLLKGEYGDGLYADELAHIPGFTAADFKTDQGLYNAIEKVVMFELGYSRGTQDMMEDDIPLIKFLNAGPMESLRKPHSGINYRARDTCYRYLKNH